MSQFFVDVPGGAPSVPTSFTTDTLGPAVPLANELQILAADSTADVDNGIRTSGATNVVTIQVTNRATGTGSTTGAVTADLITLAAGGTAGCFFIETDVVGFETTGPAGRSEKVIGAVRTDAAATTLIDTPDSTCNSDTTLSAEIADIVVSGNNIIVRVTGVAGLTIGWNAVLTFRFVN